MLNFGLDMGVEEESGDPASVTFDGDPDVTFGTE